MGLEELIQGAKEKEEQERKYKGEFRSGYQRMIKVYSKDIVERGEKGSTNMDFGKIWGGYKDVPEEYKVLVEYNYDKKKRFSSKRETWKGRINSGVLKNIAEERRRGNLNEVSLLNAENAGKFYALIDLSFKALAHPSLKVEEGKALVENVYMAFYVTREKLERELFRRFVQIELHPTHEGTLNAPDSVKRGLVQTSKNVKRRYAMFTEVKPSVRGATDAWMDRQRKERDRWLDSLQDTADLAFPEEPSVRVQE